MIVLLAAGTNHNKITIRAFQSRVRQQRQEEYMYSSHPSQRYQTHRCSRSLREAVWHISILKLKKQNERSQRFCTSPSSNHHNKESNTYEDRRKKYAVRYKRKTDEPVSTSQKHSTYTTEPLLTFAPVVEGAVKYISYCAVGQVNRARQRGRARGGAGVLPD